MSERTVGTGLVLMLVAAVLALACVPPKPPAPPPVSPVTDSGYLVCTGSQSVIQLDLCDRLFTPEGFACATCRPTSGALPVAHQGCINEDAIVYCAAPNCFDDMKCGYVDITRGALDRAAHVPRVSTKGPPSTRRPR